MKIFAYTLMIILTVPMLSKSQEERKGRITDPNKEALAGATISTLNGDKIAISDQSGNVVIKAILDIIMISHTGFVRQAVSLDTLSNPFSIVLTPAVTALEEVDVFTGYESIAKERAAGSFDHISNRLLGEQVGTDILSRLESVANGLQVSRLTNTGGGENGFRIRGLSTLSTGNLRAPLIILDNFPYEGDLENINPNDVSSVTILKDAAAASIWGSRAGNGVIVITSKRADTNEPFSIEASASVNTSAKPNIGYYNELDGRSLIEVERFLFDQQFRFSDTASTAKPAFTPVYEILFRRASGEISKTQADQLLEQLSGNDVRNDYLQHLYRPMINQQYHLSMQGGTNKASSIFTVGYDQNSSVLEAGYSRLNLAFRNSYVPVPALTLQSRILYTNSRSSSGNAGYSPGGDIPVYVRLADDDGNPMAVPKDYRQTYLDTLGGQRLLDWGYYPMTEGRENHSLTRLQNVLMGFDIAYKPLPWLSMNMKYQYQKQVSQGNMLHTENSYYARNLVNSFTQLTSNDIMQIIPQGGIMDLSTTNMSVNDLRGQLNIHQNWLQHELTAVLGIEGRDKRLTGNEDRTYGYNNRILTFGEVDYTRTYPHLITGRNIYIPKVGGFTDVINRFLSIYGNAGYTFKDRYTLTLSARRDASNLFGVNTNDKWNLLWSSGIAWHINKEPFFDSRMLSMLKIRGTYGYSGNVDMNGSAVTTISYRSNSPFTLSPTAGIAQHSNPELRWEKVRMANLAVDFAFTKGRISGSFEYFLKRGSDLFGPDPVDYTKGLSGTITKNVASLRGHGFDFELNTVNTKNGLIAWTTQLNFSMYRDKVTDYYISSLRGSNYVTLPLYQISRLSGKPLYSMLSYRWGGLDPETGDPIGFIGNSPSKNYDALTRDSTQVGDLVFSGSTVPTFYGSLGHTFKFKGVSLTFRFLGKFGYYFRDKSVNYRDLFYLDSHIDYRKRWKSPGDEIHTQIPSMVYPANSNRDAFYNYSEITAKKGDHVRLQYISLRYTINPVLLERLGVNRMEIQLGAQDVGILWKKTDSTVDPEYGPEGLPPARSFNFGLNFTL